MASNKPFNYHSGLWLLLSHIILSQTCSRLRNDSIEDSEVDNRLEKIHFDASQLQVFLPSLLLLEKKLFFTIEMQKYLKIYMHM